VTLDTDRADVVESLRKALSGSRACSDAALELMPDKGLAHHHVRLRGRGIVARIPKQSQMNLNAHDNLRYQAACFLRASAGGHAPRLIDVLTPSAALPRGALLVEEIVGAPSSLPRDLPALAEALASIHAQPLPAVLARPPLFDPDKPVAAMADEIKQQAKYMPQAEHSFESVAQIRRELQDWCALQAGTPEPPKALIAFDAHPGNFLIRGDGRAMLVDLEKARYSCPAFDLAHATLYTSTTWDMESAVELSLPEVVSFILTWREKLGDQPERWDNWLVLARRGMWLWSVTWCAKWKALARHKSDASLEGEDWSAENSERDLIRHVRDRVECYLSPEIIRAVRRELAELADALIAHGIRCF
jgi:thiamine kinase-like enzyme